MWMLAGAAVVALVVLPIGAGIARLVQGWW